MFTTNQKLWRWKRTRNNPSSCHEVSVLNPGECSSPQFQRPGLFSSPGRGDCNSRGCHTNSSETCHKGATSLFFHLKGLYNFKKQLLKGTMFWVTTPFIFQCFLESIIFFWQHIILIHVQNDDPGSSQLMSKPWATRLRAAGPAANTANSYTRGQDSSAASTFNAMNIPCR